MLVASTTGEVPTHSWNPWMAPLTKYSQILLTLVGLSQRYPVHGYFQLLSCLRLPHLSLPQRQHLETVEYVKFQLFLFCSLLGEERVASHEWLSSLSPVLLLSILGACEHDFMNYPMTCNFIIFNKEKQWVRWGYFWHKAKKKVS